MELPDAAAEGGCADNLRVEWNETRKKKAICQCNLNGRF